MSDECKKVDRSHFPGTFRSRLCDGRLRHDDRPRGDWGRGGHAACLSSNLSCTTVAPFTRRTGPAFSNSLGRSNSSPLRGGPSDSLNGMTSFHFPVPLLQASSPFWHVLDGAASCNPRKRKPDPSLYDLSCLGPTAYLSSVCTVRGIN